MEKEAAGSDEQVANEGHKEYLVMAISQTTADTLKREEHEQQIGQRVDNLSGIDGRVVVLE